MAKYFIGSNINFLVKRGNFVGNASSATYYKFCQCEFIINNRKDLCAYKIRKDTKKKNDYVLGQRINVIGDNGLIIDDYNQAMMFDDMFAAEEYVKKNNAVILKLEYPYIYNNKFDKIKDISKLLRQNKEDPTPQILSQNTKRDVTVTKRIQLSSATRADIYNKANGICAICGKPINAEDYTVDHIVPLALGGTYEEDNLQATHRNCNLMKADIKESDFYDLVNTIAKNRMMNNYNYENMLSMARAMVRGTITNLGFI